MLKPIAGVVSKTQIASKGKAVFSELVLQALKKADADESNLCPVRLVRRYLTRTDHLRSMGKNRLIISYNESVRRKISKHTISNYIKQTILAAYEAQIDPKISLDKLSAKAHKVRHMANSLSALHSHLLNQYCSWGVGQLLIHS